MKRTLTIFALVATAVIASALASGLTLTITRVEAQVQTSRPAVVVTLTNSKTSATRWAQGLAAEASGGIALLFCILPEGFYTALVLARE